MQWLNASQGKSRALNLALYNSDGKYIINLDSDGVLEPHALTNLIDKFESDLELNCMTGVVLTMPEQIRQYRHFFPRLLRELEFMEYAQAFLAGRSYASERNSLYTLSGAFSAFRKSAVLKSRLYNTDTICEDTQLTFQMRYLYGERVEVCENAIFYTEPIEDVNRLYTQRQRWQRGSLEVAQMFRDAKFRPSRVLSDVNVRTLLYDHTFAFPRLIWYLALICLLCMNYSGRTVLISTLAIFALYILVGYFYFFSAQHFLRAVPETRRYYLRHWWVVLLLPLFNLGVFFIRVAGIINSIGTNSAWKTANFTQERDRVSAVLRQDSSKPLRAICGARNKLNRAETEQESPTVLPIVWYVVAGILLLLGCALLVTVHWIGKTYGIGLNELLSTLTGNLQGTATDVVLAVVRGCVLPVAAITAVYVLLVIADRRLSRRRGKRTIFGRSLPSACAIVLVCAALYTNAKFDALSYYQMQHSSSSIYEAYYVDPNDVTITAGSQKRNLIYIYLESMETTYADTASGGAQTENDIPNLTALAQENLSFSDSGGLGGFHTVTGAGYTMAALFTTSTGVPYALPTETSSMQEGDRFASGITSLGDLLAEQGYQQEFLCGSDAMFGGRKLFFQQHGDYEIFDLYTAREQGYIPEDYYVWWGVEDKILFDIARDEATRLASSDEPFNLTMLTVDLHHIAGYTCSVCGNEYSTTTANVAACTDRLVKEFVAWCQTQPFYENTTIVITGDHPRMDTYLVDGVSYYDRTVYNCILNSAVTTARTTEREFTHMDIFPTVLAAMGYTIEGDRLGLGVNLFSEQETLAEQLGFDYLNTEVSKSSSYYVEKFAPELVTVGS
jgi:putative glycosyltransferase (exosortase G-associated)